MSLRDEGLFGDLDWRLHNVETRVLAQDTTTQLIMIGAGVIVGLSAILFLYCFCCKNRDVRPSLTRVNTKGDSSEGSLEGGENSEDSVALRQNVIIKRISGETPE